MSDKFDEKALDLVKGYLLGAYSPDNEGGHAAAIAKAMRDAAGEGLDGNEKAWAASRDLESALCSEVAALKADLAGSRASHVMSAAALQKAGAEVAALKAELALEKKAVEEWHKAHWNADMTAVKEYQEQCAALLVKSDALKANAEMLSAALDRSETIASERMAIIVDIKAQAEQLKKDIAVRDENMARRLRDYGECRALLQAAQAQVAEMTEKRELCRISYNDAVTALEAQVAAKDEALTGVVGILKCVEAAINLTRAAMREYEGLDYESRRLAIVVGAVATYLHLPALPQPAPGAGKDCEKCGYVDGRKVGLCGACVQRLPPPAEEKPEPCPYIDCAKRHDGGGFHRP